MYIRATKPALHKPGSDWIPDVRPIRGWVSTVRDLSMTPEGATIGGVALEHHGAKRPHRTRNGLLINLDEFTIYVYPHSLNQFDISLTNEFIL